MFNDGLFGGTINSTGSTISHNSAGNYGGGVNNANGTVVARNTIFSDNSVLTNNDPDFRGALNSQGFNIIENTAGTIITGTTTGNITGVDPQLLPLLNYGGATETHALRATSPCRMLLSDS